MPTKRKVYIHPLIETRQSLDQYKGSTSNYPISCFRGGDIERIAVRVLRWYDSIFRFCWRELTPIIYSKMKSVSNISVLEPRSPHLPQNHTISISLKAPLCAGEWGESSGLCRISKRVYASYLISNSSWGMSVEHFLQTRSTLPFTRSPWMTNRRVVWKGEVFTLNVDITSSF